MVKPPPYKVRCPECGYSRIIKPKSDVVIEEMMLSICPKCKCSMMREELSGIQKLFVELFHR